MLTLIWLRACLSDLFILKLLHFHFHTLYFWRSPYEQPIPVESADFPHLEDGIQPVYANYLEFSSMIELSLLPYLFWFVYLCIYMHKCSWIYLYFEVQVNTVLLIFVNQLSYFGYREFFQGTSVFQHAIRDVCEWTLTTSFVSGTTRCSMPISVSFRPRMNWSFLLKNDISTSSDLFDEVPDSRLYSSFQRN
jgi:hypothetical protein